METKYLFVWNNSYFWTFNIALPGDFNVQNVDGTFDIYLYIILKVYVIFSKT